MNVQEFYQKKLTTAAEAVTLDKALAARQSELRDVKVRGGVTMWMPEICKAEDAGEHFTWHSWHCSGIDRKIIAKGMGYFSPMRYSELPRFYRDGNAKVDVAMIQVTPMDKHGNFSYALARRPRSTPRWRTSSCRRSRTVPACSSASAVCRTPSAR